jgi:hypothetical protein
LLLISCIQAKDKEETNRERDVQQKAECEVQAKRHAKQQAEREEYQRD